MSKSKEREDVVASGESFIVDCTLKATHTKEN